MTERCMVYPGGVNRTAAAMILWLEWKTMCSNIPARYDIVAKYGSTVLISCLEEGFHQYDVGSKIIVSNDCRGVAPRG